MGLYEDMDVSSYAKLIFSGTDMREKREKLLKEKTSRLVNTASSLGIDIDSLPRFRMEALTMSILRRLKW